MEISKRFIITIAFITVIYSVLIIYIQNISLINSTLFDGTGLAYKLQLFSALITGFLSGMTLLELTTFLLTGLLIGINLTLIMQRVKQLKNAGKVHYMAGGSSILGVFAGGCASCGLPLLSLIGLSSAVLYLPFKGAELPYISIALLIISLVFLVRGRSKAAQLCKIENKETFVTAV